jgi:hypothetical protein
MESPVSFLLVGVLALWKNITKAWIVSQHVVALLYIYIYFSIDPSNEGQYLLSFSGNNSYFHFGHMLINSCLTVYRMICLKKKKKKKIRGEKIILTVVQGHVRQ